MHFFLSVADRFTFYITVRRFRVDSIARTTHQNGKIVRWREKLKIMEITVGKSVDEKRKGNKSIEGKQ